MSAGVREIILVDDERHLRSACTQALELAGYKVIAFARAEGALEQVSREFGGVLITDIKMPGTDGLTLMRRALEIDPELPVILITGHGDVPMAVQAIKDGAYEFLEKPFGSELLVETARRGMEKRRLVLENRALRAELQRSRGLRQTIIGKSAAMESLRRKIISFGETDADILISGETGTGKELIARNLHFASPRKNHKFVAINCGALPENIIESELFGHEAGAFTGASKSRIGKFEYAGGGTIFLDEIESMPLELQIKLLRVLQERVVERLGSNRQIALDIRVLAATKKNLRQMSQEGGFREDLFYRLNILSIEIAPLRERAGDIPLLFHHFAAQYAAQYKREMPRIRARLLDALTNFSWPGNVRELQNAALQFVLGAGMDALQEQAGEERETPSPASLSGQMESFEKQLLARELERQNGNLKATYETLGISRKTLYDKLRKYGLGRN